MTRKIRINEYSYTVVYEPQKQGYQVVVPLLPGLVTYGPTLNEAKEMARDAILCYLEALKKDREEIPLEKSIIQERMSIHL